MCCVHPIVRLATRNVPVELVSISLVPVLGRLSLRNRSDLREGTDVRVMAEPGGAGHSDTHHEWAGMDGLPNEILDMIYAQCSRSRLLTCMTSSPRQFSLIVPRIWTTLALGHVQSMNLTKMRNSADPVSHNCQTCVVDESLAKSYVTGALEYLRIYSHNVRRQAEDDGVLRSLEPTGRSSRSIS